MSDNWYLAYFEEAKNAAQHRIWTFYEAIIFNIANLGPCIFVGRGGGIWFCQGTAYLLFDLTM